MPERIFITPLLVDNQPTENRAKKSMQLWPGVRNRNAARSISSDSLVRIGGMRICLEFRVQNPTPALVLVFAALLLLCCGKVASGQELEQSPAPQIELLTLNGGKQNPRARGEGITSYKIGDLFKRGTTRITLVKAIEAPFRIELPIGYSVFNNLIYSIETDAVFSGPSDIAFNLPSARTKETFGQLRILYPEYDYADPEVPRWIDATLSDDNLGRVAQLLSQLDIKQRLRDFNTRTLHAFTDDSPLLLVVALRDPAKARAKFTADLEVSGTATSQVTEGRPVTYELKITNKGPDVANHISFHADPSFSFVSVNASQGKCKMSGQNVYCKFSSLEKGRTLDIKIVERCAWGSHFPNRPSGYETPTSFVSKHVRVRATERDPSLENNELQLTTEVYPDSNKGPVIEVLSPTLFQLFPGPAATVPIRFKASDLDGFIRKLELFANAKPLGEPTLRSDGEYELIYRDVSFGRHWVTILATDNLGRVEAVQAPEFFVNGLARVEITDPKGGSKLNLADGEFAVTIHASSTASSLRKVSLDVWNSDATPVGNNYYVVKLKYCNRKCRLQAIAIDEDGVETRSEFLEFTMMEPPKTWLSWFDGEFVRDFDTAKPFKVSELILAAAADHEFSNDARIIKIEIFANGLPICTDDSPSALGLAADCLWKPSPGKYRLQAAATDADGAVGKSDLIEVIIEKP